MAEFSFQEPVCLDLGRKMYERHLTDKGNAVSIIIDAMTTLRQMGVIGLDLWIDTKIDERKFIRETLSEQAETATRLGLANRLRSMEKRQKESTNKQDEERSMDAAWADMENLMRMLRHAKYYAKTQEKEENND